MCRTTKIGFQHVTKENGDVMVKPVVAIGGAKINLPPIEQTSIPSYAIEVLTVWCTGSSIEADSTEHTFSQAGATTVGLQAKVSFCDLGKVTNSWFLKPQAWQALMYSTCFA
jgi:hypothetical protein